MSTFISHPKLIIFAKQTLFVASNREFSQCCVEQVCCRLAFSFVARVETKSKVQMVSPKLLFGMKILEPAPHGDRYRMRSIVRIELGKNALDVVLGSVF